MEDKVIEEIHREYIIEMAHRKARFILYLNRLAWAREGDARSEILDILREFTEIFERGVTNE